MGTAIVEQPMAGEQTETKTVRIRLAAYEVAKKVANLKGVDLGAYISDLVLPAARKDLKAEVKKINTDE